MNKRSGLRQALLPLELPPEPAKIWRPIHYLGSKLRLADAIRDRIATLDPSSGPVCDLFAGSGTVALTLSSCREVIAADIQEYSRVLCSALLRPASLSKKEERALFRTAAQAMKDLEPCLEPLLDFEQKAIETASIDPGSLCDIVEHGSLMIGSPRAPRSIAKALNETSKRIEAAQSTSALMTTRYFGGVYFSFRQALHLDCLLSAISELPKVFHETCCASLLSTASTIVNSVGKQFAQPMRPRRADGTIKNHLIRQMCRDRALDVGEIFPDWLSRYSSLSQEHSHQVLRDDYRNVLSHLDGITAVYADPPYTRDHYSRYYHVLETLCLRDSPLVSTTLLTGEGNASRGIYRADRHQSPFCIKSQAPAAFSELFAGCKKLGVPLLLSYSPFVKEGRPRLMTVDAVANLASDYYRHVEVEPAIGVSHSKLNRSELNVEISNQAEVFITCRG